jgi:hypothetical protein
MHCKSIIYLGTYFDALSSFHSAFPAQRALRERLSEPKSKIHAKGRKPRKGDEEEVDRFGEHNLSYLFDKALFRNWRLFPVALASFQSVP